MPLRFPGIAPPPDTANQREGDYVLEKIELISWNDETHNITKVADFIELHEDLFLNNVFGTLSITDAVDAPQWLPIIGEEKLIFTITRPKEEPQDFVDFQTPPDFGESEMLPPIKYAFRIYKMDNRQFPSGTTQQYILYFTSPEKLADLKTRIQYGYENMLYSDIVAKAYDDYVKIDKPLVVEPTMFEHKFCAARLTPFEMFNILASKSISAEGNGSNYVFYEENDQFNYCSIGKLLIGETVDFYIHGLQNVIDSNPQAPISRRNYAVDFRNVEDYAFSGSFDVMKNLFGGMYASRLITYDPLRQIFAEYDYDYKANFGGLPHVDKHDICTDSLDVLGAFKAAMRFTSTDMDHDIIPWIVDHEPGILPKRVELSLQTRMTQMKQIAGMKVKVRVSGNPKRKVGQVVEFKMPSGSGVILENQEREDDRYLTGRYLVLAIHHKIAGEKWFMDLELVKDSLFRQIEYIDPTTLYDLASEVAVPFF